MFRYEVGRLAGGKGGKAPSNKLSDYLIRFEKVPTATRDKKKNKKAEKTTEQLLKESRNYWNALTGIGTKQKKQITK